MRQREFISLLGDAVAGIPLAAAVASDIRPLLLAIAVILAMSGMVQAQQPLHLVCEGTFIYPRVRESSQVTDITFLVDFAKMEISGFFGPYQITEATETSISFSKPWIEKGALVPVMDGYEATRRIKADPALRSIPIIAVTSYALSGEEKKART
jgi:hypothetical protein